MNFLVDTNVISEVQHHQGSDHVKQRFAEIPQERLLTSSIVFGELTKGVAALPNGKRKNGLEVWLEQFEIVFGDRILPFDRDSAKIWGRMVAECQTEGYRVSVSDGQIAATALQHSLIVITRNEKHFHRTGAKAWNIWETDLLG